MGVPRFSRVLGEKAVSAAGVRALFSLFPKSGKRGFLYGEFGRALIRLGESGYWRFRSPGFSLTFVKTYFICIFFNFSGPHQ